MKKDLKSIKNYKYLESVIDLKNKRTVQITYLSLTILALIFFGLFAINPTLSTIARLQKELSDNQFVDQQLQRKISNLTSLQQNYASLQNDLSVIDDAMPKNPQAPILLAQMQAIGVSANVKIISSQIFPVQLNTVPTATQKYGTFTFVVSAEGTNQDVLSFINSLSNMERVVSLDQITLSQKSDSSGELQASVRGSGYFKQ